MKLITIADGTQAAPGCLFGEQVVNFVRAAQTIPSAAAIPNSLAQILDERAGGLTAARRFLGDLQNANASSLDRLRQTGALLPKEQARLRAPLLHPYNIFAHGRAYHSHVRDFDPNAPRERPNHPPTGFQKALTSIIGPGEAIRIPSSAPNYVDFEGEFCVVFGRECHKVSRAEAMDHVAGYTIINDVSARDWALRKDLNPILQSALNLMYKNFDTFCPLGPNITTKDEIPDYRTQRLVTRVNGTVMQDTSLSELIWDIPELIETYSAILRFMPGDIMTTGTPGGVGAGRTPPVFMKAGDVVSVTVEAIGELSNPIVGP